MDGFDRVLCVHAHPDDESLWTGGTLARFAEQNVNTRVLTCTDGHLADAERLPHRIDELREALRILAAGEPRVLAPGADWANELTREIRSYRPNLVITYDAFGIYGHPDHIGTHRATLAAIEASAHTQIEPGSPWAIDELWLATLTERPDITIDVHPWLDTKWKAVRAHTSEFERGARINAFLDVAVRNEVLGTERFQQRHMHHSPELCCCSFY
ncbi:PIG-L deacetylase family protein [Antrihabitans cavernicola]|uniref:PIG-L family deacetylase n=1 Tax=Antrihabitans cavernicola TaxID=2495913 RepID=A0A5A7S6P2_9NOCA|nr:PIG-L deacetylase family protein [Spelaeibacter cavernicola]KAA0021164.1 PIG-L family deacetylase [Spelaeibacter cavernicola]